MTSTQEQSPPVVRLRRDAYAAWMTRLKLASLDDQAGYMGVSRANLAKVRKGDIKPGEQFIAAVMAKYDGSFEELFEVAS